MFVDGQLVNSTATSGTLNGSFNNGLVIGARYTGDVQFVTGLLDDVRIHDVALSQNQLGFFESTAAVPEPATWAMLLIGFAFVGSATRVRRRRKDAISCA